MAWTIGGVRVFVTELAEDTKQIIARLQPLGVGTVYQTFGYESDVYKLSGVVVGTDDVESLQALARTGTAVSLVNNLGGIGDFYVNSVSIQQTLTIWQTLRSDLPCETSTFNFTLELYKT